MIRVVLNALMVIGGIAGSILVANGATTVIAGYVLFLIGSFSAVILLKNEKQFRCLLSLQIFYVGVNTFGILRWTGIV